MKKHKNAHKVKKYDVRVLRFEKNVNRTNINNTTTAPEGDYICLGHFDHVTVESLNIRHNQNQSPLQQIGDNLKNNLLSDDNHVFSLYLLRESVTNNTSTDFWKLNTKFCSVIRLHCDLTGVSETNELLLRHLENYFCNLKDLPVEYIGPSKLKAYNFDVSYMLYDSLELGDAVVVLKSDSIVAMLEVSRCLNFNGIVRDTYTYCLIRTQLLEVNVTEEMSESGESDVANPPPQACPTDASVPAETQSGAQPPLLDYAATRFAIRDAYAADQFLKDLGIQINQFQNYPKAYFITGTTDLIVEWGPCSENIFVQHMKQIAQRGILSNMANSNKGVTIQAAFNDVITRIGLHYVNKPTPAAEDTTKKASAENKRVFSHPIVPSEISFCSNNLELCSHLPFKRSFNRILGTLESMYHNSITDDLYNLLYPSTRAMITRIASIKELNEQNNRHVQFQDDIIRYLEKWELLAGDITNLESQLVHHPELQVVRYYTPAMVLQFELEFTILCSKLLSGRDSRCFIPMLALSQNTAVSTECLLDPYDDQYNGECALITQIPSEMLYNPWKVAHQLCHEVSHYSGDVARNRKKRKNALCLCMAEWIMRYWAEPYIDNIPSIRNKFLREFRNFCDCFKHKLFRRIWQGLGNDANNCHLEELCKRIDVQCKSICNDSSLREYFQSVALSYTSEDEQLAFLGKKASAVNATAYPTMVELGDLKEHLEYLKNCLKEGYADISMIMLLGCTDDTYIQCVFADEMERLHRTYAGIKAEKMNCLINPHIDRYALVYAALRRKQIIREPRRIKRVFLRKPCLQIGRKNGHNDEWLTNAKTRANNAISAIQGNKKVYWEQDIKNLLAEHLRMPEATAIINYFVDCIENLQMFISIKDKQEDIKQLREVLKAVNPDRFDWSALQKFLFQARKRRQEEYQKEADQKNLSTDTK